MRRPVPEVRFPPFRPHSAVKPTAPNKGVAPTSGQVAHIYRLHVGAPSPVSIPLPEEGVRQSLPRRCCHTQASRKKTKQEAKRHWRAGHVVQPPYIGLLEVMLGAPASRIHRRPKAEAEDHRCPRSRWCREAAGFFDSELSERAAGAGTDSRHPKAEDRRPVSERLSRKRTRLTLSRVEVCVPDAPALIFIAPAFFAHRAKKLQFSHTGLRVFPQHFCPLGRRC